ncbi:unnamed protein product, partial [Amoebophrya sp. A25]|eukprot:GSA25T00021883001.1
MAHVSETRSVHAAAKWTMHRVKKEVEEGLQLLTAQQEIEKAVLSKLLRESCSHREDEFVKMSSKTDAQGKPRGDPDKVDVSKGELHQRVKAYLPSVDVF